QSLHAFRSGAIMVVGESRCDLPKTLNEELSAEEQRERSRPVIESWAKDQKKSTIVGLPFDEVLAVAETKSDSLFILGRKMESFGEAAAFSLELIIFDGKTLQNISAELGAAQSLVLGPDEEIWLLDKEYLRPLQVATDPLRLPSGCEYPHAWFEDEHAWLSCAEGIYTTDEAQELIQLPRGNGSCEALQPRPNFAVRGLYQKSSDLVSCGSRTLRSGPGKVPKRAHPRTLQPDKRQHPKDW
ncbi:MAG: hypothetical protein MK135_15680, partial [Polyangiaceae bacterium]|nr:hypothetical protein [Polyangiaceae bacterium]